MDRSFNLLIEYMPSLLAGLCNTLLLACMILITATPLALAVALIRQTRFGWIAAIYVNFIRLMPALILLYICFFVLPRFGIRLSPYEAAYYGLLAVAVAYLSEDMRGALKSVPHGQIAAANALALPPGRILRRVILPQAIPVAIPNFTTSAILAVQGTAIASLVAVNELSAATSRAVSLTQQAFVFLIFSAIAYLVINGILALSQSLLQRFASYD